MTHYNTLTQICDTLIAWLNKQNPPNPTWSSETWSLFQKVSLVHGVIPRLYRCSNAIAWLSSDKKNWLGEQHTLNAQRITKMHQELEQILALFAQNDIPVILLKGALLSTYYYDDSALRPMGDLDLLVSAQDFARATDLITHLNYQTESICWKHIEYVKPDNRTVVSHTSEHPDNPRKVEIHRICQEMFGGVKIDLTKQMWANVQPGEVLGQPALIIQPDMLWLHLLIHTSGHLWQEKGRLTQLLDIVKITPLISDPLTILSTVDARFTYLPLMLLKRYFPDVLPEAVFSSQQKRVSRAFHRWASDFDLVNSTVINPTPRLYLSKVLRFNEGRPRELAQILQYILWPDIHALKIDEHHLNTIKYPQLYLLLQRFKHLFRLFLRTTTRHVG